MKWILATLSLAIAMATFESPAWAGPEKVLFPEGYKTTFVRYGAANKPPGRAPARVRFLFVNTDALAKAKAGEPAPNGTILLAEDHRAKLGADGKPLVDKNGKYIPTDEILNIFVQEKRAGWGAEYGPKKRNGEWEYAWFESSGARKTGPRVNFDQCFACHLEKVAKQDYNFTFSPFVANVKK